MTTKNRDTYRAWAIFGICAINFFLSQFYRVSTAVIASELRTDLSVDIQELGIVSASFFYAFALTQIPLSIFLDRIGSRKLIAGLSLIGILGAVFFSMATDYHQAIIGRVLLGVGMSCNLMGALKLFSVWFPSGRFATLSGAMFSIGTLGNMTAATPLVLLSQRFGWRHTLLFFAMFNVLIVVLFFFFAREHPKELSRESHGERSLANISEGIRGMIYLISNRNFWIISIGSFVSYGIYAAFQALWAGPYLMDVMKAGEVRTGNIILVLNLGMIAGGPLCGFISDRVLKNRKRIITAGLFLSGVVMIGFSGLSVGTRIEILGALFFAFGVFRASGLLMYPHIKELAPSRLVGGAMTGINFFSMIGPAVFLHGLGNLMQYFFPGKTTGFEAFHTAFIICAICLFISAFFYLFTREGFRKVE